MAVVEINFLDALSAPTKLGDGSVVEGRRETMSPYEVVVAPRLRESSLSTPTQDTASISASPVEVVRARIAS